ncbi:MAG: ferrous iron transport protein B [Planctomycetes bacterium]|nr:ferrous iron transport protein B [Planctomycetota bacterium]
MTAPRRACAACPARAAPPRGAPGVDPDRADHVVALAGNPNTGKSTVFNALTGLRQHTGNWPGKTVTRAEGAFVHGTSSFKLVDLPGTYSLLAASPDEEVARDFLLFGRPDVTVIVVDATRLERNLNLVLQVLEITDRAVVCLNLVDEAARRGLAVDPEQLAARLGVPVVPTAARYRRGIDRLIETIAGVASREIPCAPHRLGRQSAALDEAVDTLRADVEQTFPGLPNARWVALRLLDGDARMTEAVRTGELAALAEPPSPSAGPPAALPLARPPGDADVLEAASALRWELGPDFHERLVEALFTEAAAIARPVVREDPRGPRDGLDRKLDRWLTGRTTGLPIMVGLLAVVLWLTIEGANVPSAALSALLLDTIHPLLREGGAAAGLPAWLGGLLFDGMYLATAWVVSVMLPPMAIFFPLFTLLEDFGYLPRVAFNLDRMFQRVGGHGKQALSMCMGLGCNAAGVIATRIIDSPRERLIAILTNNFALCNGRWPTQILIATIFIGALVPSYLAGPAAAAAVVLVALAGMGLTFLVSWGLSRTVLRGEASAFYLELPPYRPPRLLQTLYTSLIDRTVFVLWRAVVFALPAGAVIWLIGNVSLGGEAIAAHLIHGFDPIGLLIGLNGVILLAYVVAIPANEIVIPTVLMLTVVAAGLPGVGQEAGVMFELESAADTGALLRASGWTVLTAVNLMLFSLVHNPCSTTLYTIYKETRSARWTAVAALLPLALGVALCFTVAQVWRIFAGS